jgi:IS30 family transposase
VTLVDRKSGFLRVPSVAQRTARNVAKAIKRPLCHDPCETLTLDNGSEFAEHQSIGQRLKVPVCFAKPYALWQRGSN